MTLPSDWKMGQYLEWYTQLPFKNQHRESPTFIIQNTECYFQFCRFYDPPMNEVKDYYFYQVFLKHKNMSRELKSFPLVIYSDHWKPGMFKRTDVKFSSSNEFLFSFGETEVTNRGPVLANGYFIQFCFIFQKEYDPLLRLEIKDGKSNEKSTQAGSMSCAQADEKHFYLDFGELLEKGDHTDVQLMCNGGNIPAHRVILAASSKTFSGMLLESTEESKKGVINLATTEKSVMELCLEFIYKGKIVNAPIERAPNLYVLGHELKMHSLMKMCADLMITNLRDDNYISFLILAVEHNDDYFKCGLINYISDNIELLKSESWLNFSDEHLKTANEVYKKCMLKLI